MNTIQRGVITLLRSAITGEALTLPEDFSLENALDTIRRHGIVTMAYIGGIHCGLDRTSPAMEELFSLYCRAMLQSETQLREIQRLFAAFEASGIDYLPLKGCNMKHLYPKPELRLMGDADILIRQEQYEEKTLPLIQSLGYTFQGDYDPESVWDNGRLHLELHRRLFGLENRDLCRCFGSGWPPASHQEGHRFAMTKEWEFLFHFCHFVRHFRDGGIGCRHVVDLWVYLRSYPDLDEDWVRKELETLGLLEFYENMGRLMAAWFCGGPWEEKTEALTDFLFDSGSFGRADNRVVAQGKNRLRYALGVLFPGVQVLRDKYTVLKRAPWLLPLVWLYRPVYKLLFERRSLAAHGSNLNLLTREAVNRQTQWLRYVGLEK